MRKKQVHLFMLCTVVLWAHAARECSAAAMLVDNRPVYEEDMTVEEMVKEDMRRPKKLLFYDLNQMNDGVFNGVPIKNAVSESDSDTGNGNAMIGSIKKYLKSKIEKFSFWTSMMAPRLSNKQYRLIFIG
jgi:hypothetical protein